MELILIRHGETDANLKNACIGVSDILMNEKGKRQMQTTARIFYNDAVTAIYSSPLSRALESAEAINKYHNLPIEKLDGLIERDFGHWDGLNFAEIKERFPDEYETWLASWLDYEIPMGESAKNANEKNIEAIKKIIADNPNGKVIVCTHLGPIRNILAHLLGMELSGAWHFAVKNGAVCRLEIDEDGYATMLSFNEI